jgi:hypothetical protein
VALHQHAVWGNQVCHQAAARQLAAVALELGVGCKGEVTAAGGRRVACAAILSCHAGKVGLAQGAAVTTPALGALAAAGIDGHGGGGG